MTATHIGVCTEQNKNRTIWEGEIKDTLRWLIRGVITVLITGLAGLLLELGRAAHLFGG